MRNTTTTKRSQTVICCVGWLLAGITGVFLAQSDVSAAGCATASTNIVVILADDMGFSDLGCYGSRIETPHLDRLAAGGLRFTQFYNCARCCPSRAALLTGLYPHQTGIGHLLENWGKPGYTNGLNASCVTIAQLLGEAGYRTYHSGKWHVGGFWNSGRGRGNPIERGFDHAFCCNDGNAFEPRSIHYDQQPVEVEDGFYSTDAISDYAVRMLEEHGKEHPAQPFFLHLCYTVPHFPLHAKPQDIVKYRGKFREGWDAVRQRRFARQKELALFPQDASLSPRDPLARPWKEVPEEERDEWDLRMAVHAAMVDCMDQGIGRVLGAIEKLEAEGNTLILFCSDNGASAEYLDTWPDARRGHKPGSLTGTADSHRCLEVGWSNAANTPFREHKIWVHEGGIATPLIAHWPKGITAHGALTDQVAHLIDFMPTCLELAGVEYPSTFNGHDLARPEGQSLVPTLRGNTMAHRTLAWEHEGNRAIRVGDWKLVARYRDDWELYNLREDRSECVDLAGESLHLQESAEILQLFCAVPGDVAKYPYFHGRIHCCRLLAEMLQDLIAYVVCKKEGVLRMGTQQIESIDPREVDQHRCIQQNIYLTSHGTDLVPS